MSFTAITVIGFSIIFLSTTLGSSLVFFFKKEVSEKVNALFLGLAAGIMIAASVWSLLIPSLEAASDWGVWSFVPAVVGFVAGGLFLVILDKIVPHFHSGTNEEEGPHTTLNKSVKMFLAVTIHNIPEGLAVGFAFGAAHALGTGRSAFFGARSCRRHCHTEFSRGRGGLSAFEAGDGQQSQSLCFRRGKRRR